MKTEIRLCASTRTLLGWLAASVVILVAAMTGCTSCKKPEIAEDLYDDGVIRVTPFPTRHMGDRPAFSYLVEAEGKKVMFSGDLSPRLTGDDFPAYTLGSEVDLLVCEMAHFGVSEVTPWLERCQAKKVLFNHVFPLDKLDQIRALDGKWGYPIRPVDDGEQIAL